MHLYSAAGRAEDRDKDLDHMLEVVRSFNRDTSPDAKAVIAVYVKYLQKHGKSLTMSDKAERLAVFERAMSTNLGQEKIVEALLDRKKDE